MDSINKKTLTFAIFYTDSAIDTISMECIDYSLGYGRRNGVAYLNVFGPDTINCRVCGDTLIVESCVESFETNAPIKVISFE